MFQLAREEEEEEWWLWQETPHPYVLCVQLPCFPHSAVGGDSGTKPLLLGRTSSPLLVLYAAGFSPCLEFCIQLKASCPYFQVGPLLTV